MKIVLAFPRFKYPAGDFFLGLAYLAGLSYPAVDLFDIENYIRLFIQLDSYNPKLRGMSLIVSRGCTYSCTCCQPTLRSIFGPKMRIRSPQNVVDEIKYLKKRYNIRAFYFTDDTLTVFREWILEFCQIIEREHLDIVWACNVRADFPDCGLFKLMKDSGLVKIKVGIESVTDRIRNSIYKKKIQKEQIDNIIKYATMYNVQVAAFFMLGGPTETDKEVWDTINFAANSDLVEANFSIATPLPNTELYEAARQKGWSVPDSFDDFDYYRVKRPQMSKTEIKPGRLELYKKIAYLYFYLHPKRLRHTVRTILSPTGFRKLHQKLKRF